jgi:hypothetical protein
VSDAIWRPSPGAMTPGWWWKFKRHPNGCLLWTGLVDKAGYGRSKGNGPAKGEVYIHRIVYKLLVGPIPNDPELDLDVDHECHNLDLTCRDLGNLCLHRRCGDKDHLMLKTHGQNRADAAMNAIRTHCARGHLLSDDNVRIDPKSGRRHCKTCNRERQVEFRQKVLKGERKPPPSWIKAGYRDKTGLPRL